MAEQQMEQDQQQAGPPMKEKPLEQDGCLPAKILDQIRQEMREAYPGITDEELEAIGC